MEKPRSIDIASKAVKYCDRCARRTSTVLFDDLTLQELCQDCLKTLKRRRDFINNPTRPRT